MSKSIREKPAYKLTSLILSQKGPFTVSEIHTELKKVGINESECAVKLALKRLRDSGIITEHASHYSLAI